MHREVTRRLCAAVATTASGTLIGLGAAQISGSASRTLIVAFLLVAPALAIHRLLPSLGAAVGLAAGAAGAVAINTLVALSMLAANVWSPGAGIVAVGAISAFIRLVPRADVEDREVDSCPQGTAHDHLISKGVIP